MDLDLLAGLVFSFLIVLSVVVGVTSIILLKPLARHLGEYLEARADERRALFQGEPEDWEHLLGTLDSLDRRLEVLEERQEFTERLLQRPHREKGRLEGDQDQEG